MLATSDHMMKGAIESKNPALALLYCELATWVQTPSILAPVPSAMATRCIEEKPPERAARKEDRCF